MAQVSISEEEKIAIEQFDHYYMRSLETYGACEEKLQKFFPKDEWAKRHLQLVLFGRYYCKAVKPDCSSCPLKELCTDYKN